MLFVEICFTHRVSPTTECSLLLSSERHFVDKHRRLLIKRVTAVDPILDLLMEEQIITTEGYRNVRSKSTSEQKVREIYDLLNSTRAKDVFYRGLEEEEKFLLDEL